ncbi:Cupin 1 [Dillenia turbinata]|uniref:Germin-like protein n=1 Tax=Dillenia turbinata TaxID=194707 RepID=A0AAN8YXB3_9MAGN
MNTSFLFCILLSFCFRFCSSDNDNLRDYCPTAISGPQTIFINGLPCKNPVTVMPSDFKTTLLNHEGDTDNYYRSSMNIVTAAEFPGLNTLGLAIARTDMALDGMVMPHAHPRATEMLFISKGTVIAGFVDTKNDLYLRRLHEGDVYVLPQGMLHFYLNAGYELATAFSYFNSQNPGVVGIANALFDFTPDFVKRLRERLLLSLTALEIENIRNLTLFKF